MGYYLAKQYMGKSGVDSRCRILTGAAVEFLLYLWMIGELVLGITGSKSALGIDRFVGAAITYRLMTMMVISADGGSGGQSLPRSMSTRRKLGFTEMVLGAIMLVLLIIMAWNHDLGIRMYVFIGLNLFEAVLVLSDMYFMKIDASADDTGEQARLPMSMFTS